jgi:hypothetical protein
VPDRSCLSCRTTASHVDDEVKLVRRFRQLQRLTNKSSAGFRWEVAIERLCG